MKKTTWTQRRLERLFTRYNRLFWRGKLPRYSVSNHRIGNDSLGQCFPKKRKILIDVGAHGTDSEVRSTLLHEMAHAAVRKGGMTHGYAFFAQLERLLRKRAPITIGFPETGGRKVLGGIVPRRFPLSRAAIERAAIKDQKQGDQYARKHRLPTYHETDESIIQSFADARAMVRPWRTVLRLLGVEKGLLDVEGRPKNHWAAQIVAEGRKAHKQARLTHLQDQECKMSFEEALPKNPSTESSASA